MMQKVNTAVERLRSFEPESGYYLAFSGGKDSQCVYHLAKIAGVKFDAHYNLTGIDPPEVYRFIKKNYRDVKIDIPRKEDGSQLTMWDLILKNKMPPTRIARYCCKELKERGGDGRYVITGVRWEESARRKKNQALVVVPKQNHSRRLLQSGDFEENESGGMILVNDNDWSRLMLERCVTRGKVCLNPIIDWEEKDVWDFLNYIGVEHCSLYDDGFKRIGCIGCPMGSKKERLAAFERWPGYRKLYINAFEKTLDNTKENCRTAEDIFKWWVEGVKR